MKLSFVPADLELASTPDGEFVVTLKGQAVLTTRREKDALKRYNELRAEFEKAFPMVEPSADDKLRLLNKHIGEQLVDDNHYRPQAMKKTKVKGSTRTFG